MTMAERPVRSDIEESIISRDVILCSLRWEPRGETWQNMKRAFVIAWETGNAGISASQAKRDGLRLHD